jgi:hypothetical protein
MAEVRVRLNTSELPRVFLSPSGPVVLDLYKRANRVKNQAVRNLTAAKAVDTGRLRGSVAVEISVEGGRPYARVGTNLAHGRYVEEGTGIYGPKGRPIRPTTARVLRWPKVNNSGKGRRRYKKGATAEYGYATSVKGMRPRPWLRPALAAAAGTTKS